MSRPPILPVKLPAVLSLALGIGCVLGCDEDGKGTPQRCSGLELYDSMPGAGAPAAGVDDGCLTPVGRAVSARGDGSGSATGGSATGGSATGGSATGGSSGAAGTSGSGGSDAGAGAGGA